MGSIVDALVAGFNKATATARCTLRQTVASIDMDRDVTENE
jgi:hypothetical protein